MKNRNRVFRGLCITSKGLRLVIADHAFRCRICERGACDYMVKLREDLKARELVEQRQLSLIA